MDQWTLDFPIAHHHHAQIINHPGRPVSYDKLKLGFLILLIWEHDRDRWSARGSDNDPTRWDLVIPHQFTYWYSRLRAEFDIVLKFDRKSELEVFSTQGSSEQASFLGQCETWTTLTRVRERYRCFFSKESDIRMRVTLGLKTDIEFNSVIDDDSLLLQKSTTLTWHW